MGEPFDISYVFSFLPKLLGTLNTTLLIVACSLLAGIIVGFLVALPRLYKVIGAENLLRNLYFFFPGNADSDPALPVLLRAA